jgi:hypothetical protein
LLRARRPVVARAPLERAPAVDAAPAAVLVADRVVGPALVVAVKDAVAAESLRNSSSQSMAMKMAV